MSVLTAFLVLAVELDTGPLFLSGRSGNIGLDELTPGVVVNLQRPNYPYPFKRSAVADNRKTRGGRGFSIFKHSARSGVWKFNDVPNAQISAWDALYDATKGLLHPFVVELPIAGVNAAIRAPGDYPLTPSKPMFWSGQMNMEEYIS